MILNTLNAAAANEVRCDLRPEVCAAHTDSIPSVGPSDAVSLESTARLHGHHNKAVWVSSDLDLLSISTKWARSSTVIFEANLPSPRATLFLLASHGAPYMSISTLMTLWSW
jgi:hypothetical protein